MVRNLKLILAYEGTDFHGWQSQPGLRTVQSEVQSALMRILRHPVEVTASGRTDAGVHALGQCCNFLSSSHIEADRLLQALNSRLPQDVAAVSARDVPLGFHATQSAISKLYRYRIFNHQRRPVTALGHRYVYHHYQQTLNVKAMNESAQQFVGKLDFKAFASAKGPVKASYVRTMFRCDVFHEQDEIWIEVEGSGFHYNQVRNMVGTLIEVGRGHWPIDCVSRILESGDRQNAGSTAAAQGLSLQWVRYPDDAEISDSIHEHLCLNGIEHQPVSSHNA